jgi:hypothetical protein
VLLPGEEVSLTPYGAERYRKVDQANSPAYKCLPYGPTRGLHSTNPFQIIQTPDLIAIITEHIDYRMIYTWMAAGTRMTSSTIPSGWATRSEVGRRHARR